MSQCIPFGIDLFESHVVADHHEALSVDSVVRTPGLLLRRYVNKHKVITSDCLA